ncbi:MAG: methyltransferase [Muribaculaceae bacterium]|nr:methyltransferase [Muribaculaceae bacterium]
MFKFKDFRLSDAHCGQKVCSDAVLFAAWAWSELPACGTVLDVGAGSGLLSLITANCCPQAKVIAIEIDPGACTDAKENFASSPWSERLSLYEGNYLDFEPREPVDDVICNPPFFATGALANDAVRAGARHEGSLSYEGAIKYATKVLPPEGRLLLIGPTERESELIFAAEMAGLKIRRIMHVRTSPRREPTRAFWEFRKADGPIERGEMAVRNAEGKYSPEYLELVENLYHHL